MDFNTIGTFISSVGFPIACCIFLFKQNSDFQKTLVKFQDTMEDISKQLQKIDDRLDEIEKK